MDSKINLRIDETIKSDLEDLAYNSNLSLSEYLRELLADHVDNENFNADFEDDKVRSLGTLVIYVNPENQNSNG